MSQWLDLSNSSNKLKQTYVSGFIDISGEGVNIRNGSLQIFDDTNPSISKFTINSTSMNIYDGSSNYYDISNSKLVFLKDVSENIQNRLDDLISRTQEISTDLANNKVSINKNTSLNSQLEVSGNTILNSHLQVNSNTTLSGDLFVTGNIIGSVKIGGNTFINNDLNIVGNADIGGTIITSGIILSGHILPTTGNIFNLGTEESPFNALYVNKGTIYFTETTDEASQTSGTLSFDPSSSSLILSVIPKNQSDPHVSPGTLIVSRDGKVGLGTSSPMYTLDVSGTTNLSGNVTIDNNLLVDGDSSMNGRLSVQMDASFGNNLDIAGCACVGTLQIGNFANIGGNVYVGGNEYIDKTLIVKGDCTIDGTLTVLGDVSMNEFHLAGSTLSAKGDVSFNKNLYVGGNSYMNGQLAVEGDISLNGNLHIQKDVIIDGKLIVKDYTANNVINTITTNVFSIQEDLSLNGHLSINGDASFSNNVNIVGNLTAIYPPSSIPQSAIEGGVGGIYIPTEITTFDDEQFALVKEYNQRNTIIDASVNGNLSISGSSTLHGNVIISDKLTVNGHVNINNDASFSNNVNITGNLIANYPAQSIPLSALQGNISTLGGGGGSFYTPTEITTFDDEKFALLKDINTTTTPAADVSVKGNLTVDGNVRIEGGLSMIGNIYVTTQALDDSSDKIATTAYVQNTLFRQFIP